MGAEVPLNVRGSLCHEADLVRLKREVERRASAIRGAEIFPL